MVRLAKKEQGIIPISLKNQSKFSGTRNLNPAKLLQNWQTLSASHIYERCLMTPIYMHNALAKQFNDQRKSSTDCR